MKLVLYLVIFSLLGNDFCKYIFTGGFEAFQDVCPALCLNQTVTSTYIPSRTFQIATKKVRNVNLTD